MRVGVEGRVARDLTEHRDVGGHRRNLARHRLEVVAAVDVVPALVDPLIPPPVVVLAATGVLAWCLDALTTAPRFRASTRPCAFIARKTFPQPWPSCFIRAIWSSVSFEDVAGVVCAS